MVQNPGAFYRFMSPLDSSVSTIQLSWFSSPQVSHYSMNFKSSDHSIMPDPHAATPLEGIVPQSQKGVNDLSLQVHILVFYTNTEF